MALMLMLDNYMSDQIEALAPHKNMLDPNKPRTLTSVASMPKPVASTISNWMTGFDRTPDQVLPHQEAFMNMLADNEHPKTARLHTT